MPLEVSDRAPAPFLPLALASQWDPGPHTLLPTPPPTGTFSLSSGSSSSSSYDPMSSKAGPAGSSSPFLSHPGPRPTKKAGPLKKLLRSIKSLLGGGSSKASGRHAVASARADLMLVSVCSTRCPCCLLNLPLSPLVSLTPQYNLPSCAPQQRSPKC